MCAGVICLMVGLVFGGMFGFSVGVTRGSIRGRAEAYREIGNQEDKYPRVHR